MSLSKRRALWSLTIWSTVIVVFLILFLSGGGPATYSQSRGRIVAMAVLFAGGYTSSIVMLTRTRPRRDGGPVVQDERDEAIWRRAGEAAFYTVAVYVFALSVTLYTVYESRGLVPVGWLWFIGYTCTFLGMIAHAVATLILNARGIGHAEG